MDVIKQRNEMERTIGILSDTHLYGISKHFRQHSEIAFGSCDTIIHAGDLADLEILEIFHGKEVFAVHGNMCELATRKALPESRIISVNGFQIAVCHGTGNRDWISGHRGIRVRRFARASQRHPYGVGCRWQGGSATSAQARLRIPGRIRTLMINPAHTRSRQHPIRFNHRSL